MAAAEAACCRCCCRLLRRQRLPRHLPFLDNISFIHFAFFLCRRAGHSRFVKFSQFGAFGQNKVNNIFVQPHRRTTCQAFRATPGHTGSAWPCIICKYKARQGLAWVWLFCFKQYTTQTIPNSNSDRLDAPLVYVCIATTGFQARPGVQVLCLVKYFICALPFQIRIVTGCVKKSFRS